MIAETMAQNAALVTVRCLSPSANKNPQPEALVPILHSEEKSGQVSYKFVVWRYE
jgi:hypothetical protein